MQISTYSELSWGGLALFCGCFHEKLYHTKPWVHDFYLFRIKNQIYDNKERGSTNGLLLVGMVHGHHDHLLTSIDYKSLSWSPLNFEFILNVYIFRLDLLRPAVCTFLVQFIMMNESSPHSTVDWLSKQKIESQKCHFLTNTKLGCCTHNHLFCYLFIYFYWNNVEITLAWVGIFILFQLVRGKFKGRS